jgi:PPR repeat
MPHMESQVEFVTGFKKLGAYLRFGHIEQARAHLQVLELSLSKNATEAASLELIQAGSVMIGELANTIDLPILRRVYARLKALVIHHATDPSIRKISTLLHFNTMYAYLQQRDLDAACAVFEDFAHMVRNHPGDADLLVGWTAAASNLVAGLAKEGRTGAAVEVFDELARTGTAASYLPRWGKQFANVGLVLLEAIGTQANMWTMARSIVRSLEAVADEQPADKELQHFRFGCYVGLITTAVNAGAYDDAADLLDRLKSACQAAPDDDELQSSLLKASGNGVIAFSKVGLLEQAKASYDILQAIPRQPSNDEDIASITCISGLRLVELYVRRGCGEAAVEVFIEGEAAIRGDAKEGELRKYQARALMDLPKSAATDVPVLTVLTSLADFGETDRDARPLRQTLGIGALGCLAYTILTTTTRAALYLQILRLAESFPEEPNLIQGAMLMADINHLVAKSGAPE